MITKINSNCLQIKKYAKNNIVTVNKLKKSLKALKGLKKDKILTLNLA